jgi:glutamine amidotransferase-like uncharacterized protein
MKNIYLYTGSGANQANEVENTLQAFDISYNRICEHQFSSLTQNDILITPGGDPQEMLKNWQKQDLSIIQKFINDGGIYIGICAGVYVADKNHQGYDGLNLVSNIKDRLAHSQIINVKDSSGNLMEMVVENNPDLSEIVNGEVVLNDEDANPVAVRVYYGKGQVYLFAHHIEGSVYYKKLPHDYACSQYFVDFLKRLCIN